MEQMIVRPMARLDNRAALGVPCDAIRIARALGYDLKFARARMHPPERAVELVFPAVVRANAALIEHAVQSIQPPVRSPRQRIRQLVRVRAPETREHHLAADLLAVLLQNQAQIGRQGVFAGEIVALDFRNGGSHRDQFRAHLGARERDHLDRLGHLAHGRDGSQGAALLQRSCVPSVPLLVM